MLRSKIPATLVVALSCSVLSSSAFAQVVTVQDFIQALRPAQADEVTGSRSLGDLFNERGITADEVSETPSISVRVNFELDSIQLENETLLTLRALGNALGSEELSGQEILIIGHTDSLGTDEYNQGLSERRASAVVDYLLEEFGLNPDLISSDGKGESQLLYPDDPENDLNRRVEIRNITPLEE